MIRILTANTAASAAQGLFFSIPLPPLVIVRGEKVFHALYILAEWVHTGREKEGAQLIKGVSRRVIVVRSPDRRFFEEAIFIVREGAMSASGVTADQVVEEARRVADDFVRKSRNKWYHRIPAPGYVALGAALSTALWWLGQFWI